MRAENTRPVMAETNAMRGGERGEMNKNYLGRRVVIRCLTMQHGLEYVGRDPGGERLSLIHGCINNISQCTPQKVSAAKSVTKQMFLTLGRKYQINL